MHQVQEKAAALFNIRTGEVQRIMLLMLFAVFAFLADSFFATAAYALFLTTFNTTAIPFIYVGISIVGIIASFLYLRAGNRFGLMPTVLGSRVVVAVVIALIWTAVQSSSATWLLAALPIWQGVYQSLANTAFWNIAGRLFDLQQAKRLFGLIGASATIGYMLGGVLAPPFISLWGTTSLLGLAIGSMALSVIIGRVIAIRYAPQLALPGQEAEPEQSNPAVSPSSRPIWRTPYVLQIIAGYLFFMIAYTFIELLFYARAESVFPGEAQLATFLALFGAGVSLTGLLVETLGTSRLLSRFGVPGLVLLSPFILFSLAIANTALGLLGTSLVLLLIFISIAYFAGSILSALDYVATGVLYQPLPLAQRTTVQTLMDGVVGPAATGISGVLLLLVLRWGGQQALLPVLLPLMLLWLLAAWRMSHAYPRQLKQALQDRVLQGNHRVQLDAIAISILQASLADREPGPVIYALDVWQQLQPEQLPARLPPLLDHPSPVVQLEVLARIERLGVRAALPAVRQLAARATDPPLRGAALRVLLAVGGAPETPEELNALLDTAVPEVRQGVMIGLLRSGELEGVLAAGDLLSLLLRSPQPEERIFAAHVLGESGLQSVFRPILRLLDDESPHVQRAALHAAGQLDQPRLWPRVIACLERPLVRGAAAAALANGRKNALPALQMALSVAPAQANPAVMVRLARTCSRLRLPETTPGLLPLLDYPDDFVRTDALLALQTVGYQASEATAVAQIQAELAQATWLLAALVDLAQTETARVAAVRTALAESLGRLRLRLFAWLALGYDPVAVAKARDVLGLNRWSGGAAASEQHAYALELLDLIVDHKLYAGLLPLLSDAPPEARLAQLLPFFPQPALPPVARLVAIATGTPAYFTPWLRSVALFAWQELAPTTPTLLQNAATDSHPLVRETAVWGLHQSGLTPTPEGELLMLVTIEKVMFLKVVDLFSETPDEILVEVAERLQEMVIPANTTIFERGERGDSLYIIISGGVEVFSDGTILDRLGPRQLFGEMALLDAEPRAASVRTVAETRLLRLDQESFYELMDDRIEIAYGVIHVIVKRLRMNMLEVSRLQNQLTLVSPATAES